MLLGPDINCLGSVTSFCSETGKGVVWTQECEYCNFNKQSVISVDSSKGLGGCKTLSEGDPVAVKFDSSGENAALIIPILASPHGSDIQLARIKSFSGKNGYGFIYSLDPEDATDIHFTQRACSSDVGLQRDRLCAVQINYDEKPKATFLQPFLDSNEYDELTKPLPVLAPLSTVSSQGHILPVLDLSPMTDLPHDMLRAHPAIVKQAQEAAATILRTVLLMPGSPSPAEVRQESSNAQYVGTKLGKIKSWSSIKNYGFIVPDDGGPDVHIVLESVKDMSNPLPNEAVYFIFDTSELPRRRGLQVRRVKNRCEPQSQPQQQSQARTNQRSLPRPMPRVLRAGPPIIEDGYNPYVPKQEEPRTDYRIVRSSGSNNTPRRPPTGRVSRYSANTCCGEITPDTGGSEVFFTMNVLRKGGIHNIRIGERIEYTLDVSASRKTADTVRRYN